MESILRKTVRSSDECKELRRARYDPERSRSQRWSAPWEQDPKENVIRKARIKLDFEGRARPVAIIAGVKSAQLLEPSESTQKKSLKNIWIGRNMPGWK